MKQQENRRSSKSGMTALQDETDIESEYYYSTGTGVETWTVSNGHVDMTNISYLPIPVTVEAEPKSITFDARKAALIVVDMQNDFCSQGGWSDRKGLDFNQNRRPINPLKKLLPVVRKVNIPVIWLNWSEMPDPFHMPANQLNTNNPAGERISSDQCLHDERKATFQRNKWAGAIVDELKQAPGDIQVEKYRISGFWDTRLDTILRNLGIRTILFAGVNLDQCVFCTLQDANCLGYGCVLIDDCSSTTSPDFCVLSTMYNIKNCFGFVTESGSLISSLEHVQDGIELKSAGLHGEFR